MPTLAKLPAAVPVWLTLARWQDLSDAKRRNLFMSQALLSERTGHGTDAVRAAVAELEHRGLIVRVAGPSRSGGGRLATVWEVPTVKMPAGALAPSPAYVELAQRRSRRTERRNDGRFEPSVGPMGRTVGRTDGSTEEALGPTDRTSLETHGRTDNSQTNASESATVVDDDGWYVSGPGLTGPVGSYDADPTEPDERDLYSVNPHSTREYERGRPAVVQFLKDQ